MLDGRKVKFDGIVFLKKGEYKEDLVMVANDGVESYNTIDIVVEERGNKAEEIELKEIKYSYCYWNALYYRNVKPKMPVNIISSNDLDIVSIDIYINDKKIYTMQGDNIEKGFADIDISNTEIGENKIKLVFLVENEKKERVTMEDEKSIVVTKNSNAVLGVEYNKDKENYTINLSMKQEDLDNVKNILWRVTYGSFVMQNIINVSGSDEKLFTDIVFEKMVSNDGNSIDVELKQIGEYSVEAYLLGEDGSFERIQTKINSSNKTDDSGEYEIGDKIYFNVISKNNKVPVYELFVVSQDSFMKVGVENMNSMFDNVYGSEITAEYNNCVYIVKIGKKINLFRVGKSNNIHIAYKPTYNKDTEINYVLKDFEGNELDSGTMTYGDSGILYCTTEEDKHGLIKIGNKFKKI